MLTHPVIMWSWAVLAPHEPGDTHRHDGGNRHRTRRLAGGIVGGLVGGAAMGAMITMMMQPVIEVAIPALYGLAPPPNGLAGWIVHMGHSAVLGVVFAAIMVTAVGRYADSVGANAVAGIVYGIVLWAVLAALRE